MVRKGYVEQQIENLIRFTAALLGIRKNSEPEALLLAIRAENKRLTGLELDTLATLPFKALLGFFLSNEKFDSANALVVGVLMDEAADVFENMGDTHIALGFRQRALCSLLESQIHASEARTDELDARIERLERRVRDYTEGKPPFLIWQTFRWHEGRGQFSRAEESLDELFARKHPQAGVIAQQFYARLDALSDADLATGGMSRSDLNASAS